MGDRYGARLPIQPPQLAVRFCRLVDRGIGRKCWLLKTFLLCSKHGDKMANATETSSSEMLPEPPSSSQTTNQEVFTPLNNPLLHDTTIDMSRITSTTYPFLVSGTPFDVERESYVFFLKFFSEEAAAGVLYNPDQRVLNRHPRWFREILKIIRQKGNYVPDDDAVRKTILSEAKGYKMAGIVRFLTDKIEERRLIRQRYAKYDKIIYHIGEDHFETFAIRKSDILRVHSLFRKILDMEHPPTDSADVFSITRNPRNVKLIIQFLRNMNPDLPKTLEEIHQLKEDAEFFELEVLYRKCVSRENYLRNSMLSSQTSTALPTCSRTVAKSTVPAQPSSSQATNTSKRNNGVVRKSATVVPTAQVASAVTPMPLKLRTTDGTIKELSPGLLDEYPDFHATIQKLRYFSRFSKVRSISLTDAQFELVIKLLKGNEVNIGDDSRQVENTRKAAECLKLQRLVERCEEKLNSLNGPIQQTADVDSMGNGIQRENANVDDQEQVEVSTPLKVILRNKSQRIIGQDILQIHPSTATKLKQQPRHPINGAIILNCTPDQFDAFIAYLETGMITIPTTEKAAVEFVREASFWRLKPLVEATTKKYPRIATHSQIDNTGRLGVVKDRGVVADNTADYSLHDLNTTSIHLPHIASTVKFLDTSAKASSQTSDRGVNGTTSSTPGATSSGFQSSTGSGPGATSAQGNTSSNRHSSSRSAITNGSTMPMAASSAGVAVGSPTTAPVLPLKRTRVPPNRYRCASSFRSKRSRLD